MKNPVAGIKLNVQLAARRLEAGADGVRRARDLLERTERQLGRLSRLVEDLLDVSRIQAGKLEMRPDACDLAAIVREAVEEQRQAWPGRVIALAGMPRKPVPLHADADRIGQVVTNFLTNALRYSSEEKPVEVPTVTLLVNPDDAERLTLATRYEPVRLALRNYRDEEVVRTAGVATRALFQGDGHPPAVVAQGKPQKAKGPAPYSVEILLGEKLTRQPLF